MRNLWLSAWSTRRRGFIVAAIFAGMVSGASPVSAAPIQSETAKVHGVVRDASGAPLPNASVTITRFDTGISRPVVRSRADGTFHFPALFPSRYRILVVLAGFATTGLDIELSIDEDRTLTFALIVARTMEPVTVVATESPLVDPSKTSLGRTINAQQIDNLPISAGDFRSLAMLAMLVPGILSDLAARGGGTFGTAGQNDTNTTLLNGVSIDGADLGVPLEAIQEFKIVTNHFSAEFGQASGAVVNLLIRSGTNTPFSTLRWLQQEGAWNARSATARLAGAPDPGLSQEAFGGSWSGPVVANRAFLFASVEQTLKHTNYTNTSPVASIFRPADPLTVPVEWRLPRVLVRGDVSLGPGNTLTVEYIHAQVNGSNAAREPLSAIERTRALVNPVRDLMLGNTHVIGSKAVHELKVHWNRARFTWSVDGFCPGCATLNYPDIGLGKPANGPTNSVTDRIDLVDTWSWLVNGRGRHDIKVGLDATYAQLANNVLGNLVGTYKFNDNLPFDATNALSYPAKFTQNQGNQFVTARETIAAFFVQDAWQLHDGVSINLGVRWDHTRRPGASPQNDVAPRVGVAFDPWQRGTTVFRGGLGRYYDEGSLLQHRAVAAGLVTMSIAKPGFQGDLVHFDPFGPNPNRGNAPAVPHYSVFADVSTRTPYTDQASLGLQQQLGSRMAIILDVVRARGHLLPIGWDLNYPDAAGVRPSPDTSLEQILTSQTRAQSWYSGLQVGVERRVSKRYGYSLAYTWSSSEDNTDGVRAIPSDQTNLMADRGPTPLDIRHQFTGSVTINAPLGFRVSTIAFARSGLPYNITTGTDDNNNGVINDRPPGVGRNSARGAGFFEADVRISRMVPLGKCRLEVLTDVFNITNHDNWADYVGAQGALTFGRPTSAGPPRQIQIGARLEFGGSR